MENKLELVPTEPQAVTRHAALNVDVNALLEKAVDAKSAVEIIERLQAMRREMRAEQAEEAFDRALTAFQAECPIIIKGKSVTDTGGKRLYDYAPLEQIVSAVRPLLQKHGFNYVLDTDVESKDGWVIAKCTVTHELGAKRSSVAKFPLGAGTRAMSTTQIFAAALTFASRRVFCNAFGIITGGEDQDGVGERPKFDPGDGLKKSPTAEPAHAVAPPPDDDALKRKLVDMTRSVHLVVRGYKLDDDARRLLTQHLIDEAYISDTQTVSDLAGDQLAGVVAKMQAKQREQ